ncbi:MAG TPA: glutamine synthetase III, partial [Solirubrobacterales bacterium]|nr:glutamine synthetase III [Solirubrobacterales bacterium]
MTPTRQHNVKAAQWKPENNGAAPEIDATTAFGANVFTEEVAKQYMDPNAFEAFKASLAAGEAINLETANAVADAMKDWAISRGVTHYTHWFQPLTGKTA